MSGSTEIEAARARIDTAVNDYLAAIGYSTIMPMEWIVVHAFEDLAEGGVGVGLALPCGSLPLHRQLGLLEYAAARCRRQIMED